MSYKRKDAFYHKAKQSGYRSRAAYKLLEIQQRFKILKPGQHVIDLGCAPGSWLQVVQQSVGQGGSIVGIDLLPMQTLPGIHFIQADIFDSTSAGKLKEKLKKPADIILSDMAPNTSGQAFRDQAASHELIDRIVEIIPILLKKNGILLFKLFPDTQQLVMLTKTLKQSFQEVKNIKLKSTRSSSQEIYVLCRNYK